MDASCCAPAFVADPDAKDVVDPPGWFPIVKVFLELRDQGLHFVAAVVDGYPQVV